MITQNGGKDLNISYTINGKTETIETKNGLAQRSIPINDGSNQINISNAKDNRVYVRILNSGKVEAWGRIYRTTWILNFYSV